MHLSTIIISFLTSAASASTVYLIHHGEKPSAVEMASILKACNAFNVSGMSSELHLGTISGGKHERPLETVQPLANDLGLTVDTSCDRDDSNCVANLVDNYDGEETGHDILICWEHGQLADIAEALGDRDAHEYLDDSFNIIWTDPAPYNTIISMTSENCPGLDS